MEVIIIGNGFDLNLGFKTSYIDFIASEPFKKLYEDNNRIAKLLKEKVSSNNWIDVETELALYSQSLTGKYNYHAGAAEAKNIQEAYATLSEALVSYLRSLDYTVYNKESDAYNLINGIQTECTIIDFNYTPTLQNIIKDTGKGFYGVNVVKVHGSIEEGKGIVFGVSDKAPIHPEHVFFRKGYSPFLDCNIFNQALSNASKVSFFGYSLGDMDHTYFYDYFSHLCMPNSNFMRNINIHYYGEESYSRLFKQLELLSSQRLTSLKKNHSIKLIEVK